MSLKVYCDPCTLESKTVTAARYCSDCEEHLCKECAESHTRFKAFRSHHIIDLKSLKSKLPTPNKNCEIHPDILLEFFCTQDDVSCCRTCIADSHRSCDKILPLDVASKNIKTSSLLLDSLSSITDYLASLEKLLRNREDNLNSLQKTKSNIIQQIGHAKIKLIKQLDQLEETLIGEVTAIEMTGKNKINQQKRTLSEIQVGYRHMKQDLELLKEHGSNTQLFLSLRQTITLMEENEDKLKRLSSLITEIGIEFNETEKIITNLIGSVSEIKRPCPVEYKPKKQQQAQTKAESIKSLTELEVDGNVKFKSGDIYHITCADMAITRDNNLLLCNWYTDYPKVYMYKDCKEYHKEITCSSGPYGISVIPEIDKAVITLPGEKSIQFLNTTDLSKGYKLNIRMYGYDINPTNDKIFIGGRDVVKILDKTGSDLQTINVGVGDVESLYYDEDKTHFLFRSDDSLYCCEEHGTVLFQYKVSGHRGLAVDRQSDVYVSMRYKKEIHRLTPDGTFRDSVRLTESPGAITFNNDYSKLFVLTDGFIQIFKSK